MPVILVEGRLWQAAVFARFVATTPDRDNTDARVPSPRWLAAWVDDRFGVRDANLQLFPPVGSGAPAANAWLGGTRRYSDCHLAGHGQLPLPNALGLGCSR